MHRMLRATGERAVYGFVAGIGVTLLYAAAVVAAFDMRAMIVGLLLLGVAAVVLVVAVLWVVRPAPHESGSLPVVIEQAMAHERRAPGPRSRVVVHDEATRVIDRVDDVTATVPIRMGERRG
jgi:hypothetical protein